MNKKVLSESDICDRFISPALTAGGWDETRWRREYPFTAGRIIVRGELIARGKKKRADYLLFYKSNIPIAVIEAKDNTHSIGAGMLKIREKSTVIVESERAHSGSFTHGCGQKAGKLNSLDS